MIFHDFYRILHGFVIVCVACARLKEYSTWD